MDMDSIREVLLDNAKRELVRLLLCKDNDELTEREVDILYLLMQEDVIQKKLEKKEGE